MSTRLSVQLAVGAAVVAIVSIGAVCRAQIKHSVVTASASRRNSAQAYFTPTGSVMTQDSQFLYVLRGEAVSKIQKSDLKPVGASLHLGPIPPPFAPTKPISSIVVENADFRDTLRNVFKGQDVSYSVAPEVQGTVSVNLTNVSLDTALQAILRPFNATYRLDPGVYEIYTRPLPRIRINADR